MAKFRTKKSNRTTYVYRDAHDNAVILRPGENGVTEADIALLYRMDDDDHNEAKKDSYYGLLHFGQSGDDEVPDSMEKDLADNSANPETLFFGALEAAEKSGEFHSVWTSLTQNQRDLILKKLQKRSNVDIATEEGVTETAIRNRLSKIQKRFEKFLK
ncbi:MAG: hypothetical protein LBU62_03480 [Bacteroidales bacterium]|jgi:DNA-directed RNA polymerase specialized sigma24 family protein|nr:hypothetical protein [Bacteroidales bacterium]